MQAGVCSSACKLEWEAESGFLYFVRAPGYKSGQYAMGSGKQKNAVSCKTCLWWECQKVEKGALMLAQSLQSGPVRYELCTSGESRCTWPLADRPGVAVVAATNATKCWSPCWARHKQSRCSFRGALQMWEREVGTLPGPVQVFGRPRL